MVFCIPGWQQQSRLVSKQSADGDRIDVGDVLGDINRTTRFASSGIGVGNLPPLQDGQHQHQHQQQEVEDVVLVIMVVVNVTSL